MEKRDLLNMIPELVDSIDENGDLPLLKRYSLRDLLKPNNDQNVDRWHVLESHSARKVQDIWERHFPFDHSPFELLRIADSLIIKPDDVSQLRKLLIDYKSTLDDKLLLGEEYFQGVYAGFASWAAASNVVYGSRTISDDISSEFNIDSELWDASFYASLAWAGGAVWEEVGDSDKRREFWTWFLNEALPQTLHFSRQSSSS